MDSRIVASMSLRAEHHRGGYITMPLKANVPVPRDKTWKETICPRCGRPCWDRPLPEGFSEDQLDGKYCTECAITLSVSGR